MPEPNATPVVAVDFGASSIRVCRVDLAERPPTIDVVHRVPHGPVADGRGRLRWDWDRLVAEMERGLVAALDAGPVASIGVDTWGVDYGLLDRHGELVAPPVSYRDARTDDVHREVVDRIGAEGVTYTPRREEAVALVDRGEAEAAFLLRPTRIEDVWAVAGRGDVMPQKSTFFYPKLTSGLLMLPLDE